MVRIDFRWNSEATYTHGVMATSRLWSISCFTLICLESWSVYSVLHRWFPATGPTDYVLQTVVCSNGRRSGVVLIRKILKLWITFNSTRTKTRMAVRKNSSVDCIDYQSPRLIFQYRLNALISSCLSLFYVGTVQNCYPEYLISNWPWMTFWVSKGRS